MGCRQCSKPNLQQHTQQLQRVHPAGAGGEQSHHTQLTELIWQGPAPCSCAAAMLHKYQPAAACCTVPATCPWRWECLQPGTHCMPCRLPSHQQHTIRHPPHAHSSPRSSALQAPGQHHISVLSLQSNITSACSSTWSILQSHVPSGSDGRPSLLSAEIA